MITRLTRNTRGFTLVEIMVVVAIIALIAAVAVPSWLRARKRSQATRVLEDLRMLDSALNQYAIDTGKSPGLSAGFADLKSYVKTDTSLYSSGTDIFGNTYGPFTVDITPKVPSATFSALSDVADNAFWSPFN